MDNIESARAGESLAYRRNACHPALSRNFNRIVTVHSRKAVAAGRISRLLMLLIHCLKSISGHG